MNKYITEEYWYSVDDSVINDFARKVVDMFKEQCPEVVNRDFICLEWQADTSRVGDGIFLSGVYHYDRNPEGDDTWNIRNKIYYDWSNWSEDDIKSLKVEYKDALDTIEGVVGGLEADFIVENWITWYDIETGKMIFNREEEEEEEEE